MPDLNCTEFEAQLEQLVEDHQTLEDWSEEMADPESGVWRNLRDHAHACSHCRGLWNDFALLERVMVPWKECVPTMNLADAVLSRWKVENPSPPSHTADRDRLASTRRSLWPMLLMAAVVLLASFPFWFPRPTEEELPEMHPVATNNPQGSIDEPPDIGKTLSQTFPDRDEMDSEMDWDRVAQDARSAYWVLASDTADAFATVSVLLPPQKPAKNPEPVPADPPQKGWTEELGSGLKPISQDIGRASGFLLDALPTL